MTVHTPKKQVKLSFDAASTSAESMRHWRGAEQLSADAELIPSVRHLIVSRARYEAQNSGYLQGILQTIADDTIGTGPRLQVYGGDRTACANRERRWRAFATKIKLSSKLRLARMAKARDGEIFIQKISNPTTPLDIALFESEQVGSILTTEVYDYYPNGVPKEVDGILYDKYGSIKQYRFFSVHPWGYTALHNFAETYLVKAQDVIHYANLTRPGQSRGISEIASSLTVFSDLRRYGEAVLANAETAAQISFLLETDAQPDTDTYDYSECYTDNGKLMRPVNFADVLPIAKNSGLVLPEGWKGQQLRAEQPTSNYTQFTDAKLNEAARALSMPLNIAKCNSSSYNYSSGQLDHQAYHRRIDIERKRIEEEILDNILNDWTTIDKAYFPEDYNDDQNHAWMWDAWDIVNATKEAQAQTIRLANKVTTLAQECAAAGRDWEEVLKQRARERELMVELGLPTENEEKITVEKTDSTIEEEDEEE